MKTDSEILNEVEDAIVNGFGEEGEPYSKEELHNLLQSIATIVNQRQSSAFEAIHAAAKGFHKAGMISDEEMGKAAYTKCLDENAEAGQPSTQGELHTWIVIHTHRFGSSAYLVKSKNEPERETLVEKLELDFEEDREESIEIFLVEPSQVLTV